MQIHHTQVGLINAAMEERDAAVTERDAAMEERDAAVTERDAAMEERDEQLMALVQCELGYSFIIGASSSLYFTLLLHPGSFSLH